MSAKLHFRPHINNQLVLFPQRIDEDIAPNDPVRLSTAWIWSVSGSCTGSVAAVPTTRG